jgi:hypothetical protein
MRKLNLIIVLLFRKNYRLFEKFVVFCHSSPVNTHAKRAYCLHNINMLCIVCKHYTNMLCILFKVYAYFGYVFTGPPMVLHSPPSEADVPSLVWRHNMWSDFSVHVMMSQRKWKKTCITCNDVMTISLMAVSQSEPINYFK